MIGKALTLAAAATLLLCGCGARSDPAAIAGQDGASPAGSAPEETYDDIREDETLRFTGTEPFWGGETTGRTLRYSTLEDQDGTAIRIERFAGRGGLAYSGLLNGEAFDMTVTPLACSDGMSDRTYPFTVTLKIGEDTRNGCGWTERQPFEGPENP